MDEEQKNSEQRHFEKGWTLGYTQGQYNMRRVLLRKLGDIEALRKWLEEWPRKRRKKVKP